MMEKHHVFRINLKTATKDRQKLIDFCLNHKEQYVAIGWSCAYEGWWKDEIHTYKQYYMHAKRWSWRYEKRADPAWKIFYETRKDDLFWTRDLDGNYWICRAKGEATAKYDEELDIGAVVPVEAYKVGIEVPEQISGSFNRRTAQRLYGSWIEAYSKSVFNKNNKKYDSIENILNNLFEVLSPKALEELVIDYLQLKKNYYVLFKSIMNYSTNAKIECEFRARNMKQPIKKAVVKVEPLKFRGTLDAQNYESYVKDGYKVYLFGPKDHVVNVNQVKNCERITEEELMDFYHTYKSILPDSITKWENIIGS